MPNERFYDQVHALLEAGEVQSAMLLMMGQFNALTDQSDVFEFSTKTLRSHKLHELLMQDPYTARAFQKPRGYPGDAALIDLFYDQQPPPETSALGRAMFEVSGNVPGAAAVRERRVVAERLLADAWGQGKSICVLACGHLREADALAGKDLRRVTAVDLDPLSLERVREKHGARINLVQANVFSYLRAAAKAGETFDLIYTLGLTDYLDERAMALLHRLAARCLARQGTFFLANFLKGHLTEGWMDAAMAWPLICRDEAALVEHATKAGLRAHTFRDPTQTLVYCEMQRLVEGANS